MTVGIAIFFVLLLISATAIIYPLIPRRSSPSSALAIPDIPIADGDIADGDIDHAVRESRRSRGRNGDLCPTCGNPHKADDRFCVHCGDELPQAVAAAPLCPSCGATLNKDDRFCSKCGHSMAPVEMA